MSTKQTPQIELIPFKDLHIDTLYSGRDEKEIKANAKELAPSLSGGWDSAQPGQYFVGADGKKYLVAGFTRVEAARLNELKSGYFIKSEGDEIHHLTSCLRTNSGKPLSRKAQGERYISLRNGLVADDFKGATADPKNDADWKRKPMTLEEIAALPGVGKTAEHIKQCILVAEDPLFEQYEEKISVNAFIAASNLASKHYGGSEAKLEKIVKAAIHNAESAGRDFATPKHFDAIKHDFIPEKKLVAAPVEQDSKPNSAPESPKDDPQPETNTDTPEPEPTLISHDSPVKPKDARTALITIIANWCDETANVLGEDEIEALADKIIDAKLPI